MPESIPKTVVIIGAGVLGLTTATHLQLSLTPPPTILLLATHLPSDIDINYASPWAGAHHRQIPALTPAEKQAASFYRVSYQRFEKIAQSNPEAGIKFMRATEYLAAPSVGYLKVQGGYADVPKFRVLGKDELPSDVGITFGAEYQTWCLNSPVYCSWLLRGITLRGGKVVRKTLVDVFEAFTAGAEVLGAGSTVDLVINCSGIGIKDTNSYPIRGQTCLVANPCDCTITQQNADGSWTFIIPRPIGGGTVIGGTKQPGDWSSDVDIATREQILKNAAKMYPKILNKKGGFDIIRDIVGRRPARKDGLRLEVEWSGDSLAKKKIIHAYGAAGSGYELSWGIAEEVLKMLKGESRGYFLEQGTVQSKL